MPDEKVLENIPINIILGLIAIVIAVIPTI
jgi:hypothetical protein